MIKYSEILKGTKFTYLLSVILRVAGVPPSARVWNIDFFPPAHRVSTQQSSLCVFACSSHLTSPVLRIRLSRESSDLGWVARSMVSANHWLRGIKTYRLSWHLTRVSANHASSNWALLEVNPKLTTFACLRWGKKETLLELSLVVCWSVVVCGKYMYTKINVKASFSTEYTWIEPIVLYLKIWMN